MSPLTHALPIPRSETAERTAHAPATGPGSRSRPWEIGDVVFSAELGAGRIAARQVRTVQNGTLACWIVQLGARRRSVVVPVDEAILRGWRRPATRSELDATLVTLSSLPKTDAGTWSERMQAYRRMLAAGTLEGAAAVARDLHHVRTHRDLGHVEETLFTTSRAIVESELSYGLGLDRAEARRRLDQLLGCFHSAPAGRSPNPPASGR